MGAGPGSPARLVTSETSTPEQDEHVGLLSEEGMGRGYQATSKLG